MERHAAVTNSRASRPAASSSDRTSGPVSAPRGGRKLAAIRPAVPEVDERDYLPRRPPPAASCRAGPSPAPRLPSTLRRSPRRRRVPRRTPGPRPPRRGIARRDPRRYGAAAAPTHAVGHGEDVLRWPHTSSLMARRRPVDVAAPHCTTPSATSPARRRSPRAPRRCSLARCRRRAPVHGAGGGRGHGLGGCRSGFVVTAVVEAEDRPVHQGCDGDGDPDVPALRTPRRGRPAGLDALGHRQAPGRLPASPAGSGAAGASATGGPRGRQRAELWRWQRCRLRSSGSGSAASLPQP